MIPENAYRLLGLDMEKAREITLEDIRNAYKRRAILVHPDKPNGSQLAFNLMYDAYKSVVALHTLIVDEPMEPHQAEELVKDKKIPEEDPNPRKTIDTSTCYRGGRFDPALFNENFRRGETPYDKGYNSFLAPLPMSSRNHRPDTIAPLAERPSDMPSSMHLIKYTEPLAMNGFGCGDLSTMNDNEKISDFSGENLSAKRLQFTDVQLAHTTQKIAEESYADERLNFDNLDALTAYRNTQLEHISYKN